MLSFTFYSCQDDDFLERETNTQKSAIQHSSQTFSELENNSQFISAYHQLSKQLAQKSNVSGKGGEFIENRYGVKIDSSLINVARTELYTSYTMFLHRAEQPAHYFENLVIEVTDTAATKAYVMQYFPRTPITQTADESFIFEYNYDMIPIQYDEGSKYMVDGCGEVTVTFCNNGPTGGTGPIHHAGPACDPNKQWTEVISPASGCGGDSQPIDGDPANGGFPPYPNNPQSGSNPGGGGAGHGNNEDPSNTTITNPIPCYKVQVDCVEMEVMETDPCDELNNMNKEKPYLNVLRGKVYSTREYGYYFDEGIPGATEADLIPGSLELLNMPVSGTIYGSSHNHPYMQTTKYLPMFGIEDIMWIGKAYYANIKNPRPPISKFFNTLTVDINGTKYHFAIKIENKQEFLLSFYEQYLALSKLEKFNLEDDLKEEYTEIKKDGGNSKKYVEALYKFLEEKNINGVGIYEANLNPNSNNDIENWSKLEYTPNNQQNHITAIPCE